VWLLALGNDLNITPDLFRICTQHAERAKKEKEEDTIGKEGTVTLIPLDLPRTFPALSFFAENGPYHPKLREVLEAYVCHRPDVGYVQGMSYVAALLLLVLSPYDAFSAMCNLLNRKIQLTFYSMDINKIQKYYKLFALLLSKFVPEAGTHLEKFGVTPELYLIDWILTLYAKSLPLDVATRVWDVYLFEGDSFLFRTGIGLIKLLKKKILLEEMEGCMSLISHIYEQGIEADQLLSSIKSIDLTEAYYEEMLATVNGV